MYYLLLMGSGFMLALAISQLCVPRRNETNTILFLVLLVCLVWLTHGIGFKLGMLDVLPHLNKIHVPFLAACGPLWYLYVRAVHTGQGRTQADKVHVFPVLASVILLLPFVLQSEQYKRDYVEVNIIDMTSMLAYAATRIAELATIVYLALTIWLLQPERVQVAPTHSMRPKSILLALTTVALIAAITRLYGSVVGNHTISVLVPIVIILMLSIGFYCLSYRHTWLMALGYQVLRSQTFGINTINGYYPGTPHNYTPTSNSSAKNSPLTGTFKSSLTLPSSSQLSFPSSHSPSSSTPCSNSHSDCKAESQCHAQDERTGQFTQAQKPSDQASERLNTYRNIIRKNGWHLDPNLKIYTLARRLGLPAHDLSEFINRESDGNFNHFINGLRIEHAKEQLRNYADKPVLDIALSSGFNSASAFYAQFSRFENMPPATYRRRARSETDRGSELVS